VIKAADLENLAYDARATERLDEWERRLSDTLLGTSTSVSAPARVSPANTRARFPELTATPSDPDVLDALLDDSPPQPHPRR
jgi:hypothetical protein